MRSLGDALSANMADVANTAAWANPMLNALNTSPVCSADPSCASSRAELQALVNAQSNGTLNSLADLARNLQSTQGDADPRLHVGSAADIAEPSRRRRAVHQRTAVQDRPDATRRQRPRRWQPGHCRWCASARRPDQEVGIGPQRGVVIPAGDEARREQAVDGGLQHSPTGADRGRVQESRPDFPIARRTCGAILRAKRASSRSLPPPWIR